MIQIENHAVNKDAGPLRVSDNAVSGHPVYAVKVQVGWRSLDSPYRPVEEAREAVTVLPGHSVNAIVLGLGSGFLLRELLQHDIGQLLLITPSAAIAERNAILAERALQHEALCRILIADCLTDTVRAIIEDFFSHNQTCRVVCHPRETKIFFDLFENIQICIAAFRTIATRRSTSKSIRRILFPCSGQLFEADLCDALRRKGLEVQSVASLAHATADHLKVMRLLCDGEPDLVLSTNNKGSDRYGLVTGACTIMNIPWATWFLDEPGFMVSPFEGNQRQRRIAFCWDIAGIESCRALGFSGLELLPLAGNPDIFSPGSGDPSLCGRIVYVGSPGFGNETKYFSNLCRDPHALAIAASLEVRVQNTRFIPGILDIRECMADLAIRPDYFPRISLERLPAFVVYRANLSYRVKALTSIAELRPVVYGDGWDGLLPRAIELRGHVDYYRDLVNVYRSDAVHLSLTHLQMRHYPNQRIFDAGLCGRVVIGERLSGTEELFGPGLNEVHFTDFEHMRDTAEWLIRDTRHRHRFGDYVRDVVLKKHTIDLRIDRILEHIGSD